MYLFSTTQCWKTIIVDSQRRTRHQPPRNGYQHYIWPEPPPPPTPETHQKKDIVVLKRAYLNIVCAYPSLNGRLTAHYIN